MPYQLTTLTFSHDSGYSTTTVDVEVEYTQVGQDKIVTDYYLPASFDKSVHSDWQAELSQQLRKDYGMNTDEI